MAESEQRKLVDLRVVDLKSELDRRGLDKNGIKSVLLERLEKAIKDEGLDPENYVFETNSSQPQSAEKKPPNKRISRSESAADGDVENQTMEVDTTADESTLQEMEDGNISIENATSVSDKQKDKSNGPLAAKTDLSVDQNNITKDIVNRKRDADKSDDKGESKRSCLSSVNQVEVTDKRQADINGLEAEDSINLDIGEDELLNDEGEAGSKSRKDESGSANSQTTEAKRRQEESGGNSGAGADGGDTSTTGAGGDAALSSQQESTATADPNASSTVGEEDKDKDGKKQNSDGSATAGTATTPSVQARNLWVSGLSGITRARDLKLICSKYGKVIGAKVVTNARKPGSRCYGYVTMASDQDAECCIKHLHLTELHGRMILVEKAKSDLASSAANSIASGQAAVRTGVAPRAAVALPQRQPRNGKDESTADKKEVTAVSKDKKEKEKEGEDAKPKEKDESKKAEDGDLSETSHSRKVSTERKEVSRPKPVDKVEDRSRGRPLQRDILSHAKIRKERDIERMRDRSRSARRRRAAEEALRERERRTRQEKQRLALEREKLRIERERIEREKNELLRLERERQKLEREKLELERLELKRAQMRLEEERAKRQYSAYERASASTVSRVPPSKTIPPGSSYDSRHKSSQNSSVGGRFDAPPPPSFDTSASSSVADKRDRERDYKREYAPHPRQLPPSHSGSGSLKYSSNGQSYESRQPMPPGTRPKDHRYENSSARDGRDSNVGRSSEAGRNDASRSNSRGGGSLRGGSNVMSSDRGSNMYRETSKPDHSRYEQPQSQIKEYGGGWSKTSASYGSSGSRHAAMTSSHGSVSWSSGGAGSNVASTGYDARYSSYQPAPPGATPYSDTRYASQAQQIHPQHYRAPKY